MSISTKTIFYRRALQNIFADEYIDWAGEMLMQDYDSPNLRILAGLDRRSNIFEVEDYFRRSIKELNIEEIESETTIRAYACELAQQIIDGQFPVSDQAIRGLAQIFVDAGCDADYVMWSNLADVSYSLRAGEAPYSHPAATLENFDAIVKQEAARFIAIMNN